MAPLLAANGDLPVELLLDGVRQAGGLIGFLQTDRDAALSLLLKGEVAVAGYHGEPIPSAKEPLAWVHLARREVGLATRSRKLRGLGQLRDLKLASRPATAGVRLHLDRALASTGINSDELHARALLLEAHREVVCAVARGAADVGLTTRGWAERLGLSFYGLTHEPYRLAMLGRDLGHPTLLALLKTAQGRSFRRAVASLRGYEVRQIGAFEVR